MEESFSYSKLDVYHQCPFRYRLQYVEKLTCFSENIATEFGSLVHKTEEEIAKCIQASKSIPYIELKNNFIKRLYEIEYKYKKDYLSLDKSNRTYQQKAYEYLRTGIYGLEKYLQENPNMKIVGIEQKFKIYFKNKLFKGSIDRVLQDTTNDTFLIQDIKTYPQPLEKENLTTPLQFVIYVLAAKELYNKSEDCFSCSYELPLCNISQSAGTKGFMKRGIEKLDTIFGCIENQQFKPSPTPLCHWCSYCPTNPNAPDSTRFACPYYSMWTPENKTKEVANLWEGDTEHSRIMKKHLALIGEKLYK